MLAVKSGNMASSRGSRKRNKEDTDDNHLNIEDIQNIIDRNEVYYGNLTTRRNVAGDDYEDDDEEVSVVGD